jgi:cytochrome c biogenesis protein CcmG/thiol:disulfide interchange protein DsbE
VNYKDQEDNAVGFLEELGNPYRAVGRDEQGRMALDWGVYGVPETYVIDGEGTIILRFAGPITQRVIDSTIRPALDRAAGTAGDAGS